MLLRFNGDFVRFIKEMQLLLEREIKHYLRLTFLWT